MKISRTSQGFAGLTCHTLIEGAIYVDRDKRESIDWKHFDWSKVEGEIDENELSEGSEELESLPRAMFVEYVRHLHDDEPELYHLNP